MSGAQVGTNSSLTMSYVKGGSPTCIESIQASHTYCMFPIQISNISKSPVPLNGTFYATVDGNIFEASSDTGSTGIQSVSDTWNPGDVKSAMPAFDVPTGRTIQNIFVNTNGDGNTPEVIMSVNVKATTDTGSFDSSQPSTTTHDSPDSTGILKRLNSAGSVQWSKDVSVDLTNSQAIEVLLSSQCGVGVFKDEQSAQAALDNDVFGGNSAWIGTDSVTDDGIALLSDDAQNVCAQKVVKVMNWNGINN